MNHATTRLLAALLASTAADLVGLRAAEPAGERLEVKNPSFEAFYLEPGGYRNGDIDDWPRDGGSRNQTGIQSVSDVVFTRQPGPGGEIPFILPAPADGAQFAFLNPASDNSAVALYQVIGPLRSRTRYTLVVAVGNRRDKGYADRVLLELRNGDSPAAPLLAALTNSNPPPDGGFADHQVVFETGSYVQGNLVIVIRNQTAQQIAFDNVRLHAERLSTVPATSR